MAGYGSFLLLAVVLVLIPGPDFVVVSRNVLAGGRGRGMGSAAGVASSNAVQGVVAAAGLGAVVVRVEPLFQAIKWAGIAYLAYLAFQALRSAYRGVYEDGLANRNGNGGALKGWRQGFLSNITNPKVLVFYLAVLPQFVGTHDVLATLVLFALSHAALSLVYLMAVVMLLSRARRAFASRRVRRVFDVLTGGALIGFGTKLAAENV